MLHITRGVYETSFHLSIFHESIYKRATIFNQNHDGDSQISNSLFRLFRQSLEDYQDSPLKTISSHHQSPVNCPIGTVEVAGLDSGYAVTLSYRGFDLLALVNTVYLLHSVACPSTPHLHGAYCYQYELLKSISEETLYHQFL